MITQAVILAAGLGQRLGSQGEEMPKGLLTIGGEKLVPRSIRLLRDAGIGEIMISTGHLAEHYKQTLANVLGVTCQDHDQYASTGSMYTLYNIRQHIQGDFLLLESDILYEPRALQELLQHPEKTVVLVSHLTGAGDECYVESDSSGQLVNISKQPGEINNLAGELVGISKISTPVFAKMCQYWESHGASQPRLNYEDALVGVTKQTPVSVHRAEGLVWCEVDTPEHFQRATHLYEKHFAPAISQAVR